MISNYLKEKERLVPKITQEKERPPRGSIDQQEYASILDKEGSDMGYVHGTYKEVEFWCEEKEYWVDRYMGHVDPMTVQKHFKYVGSGANPCSAARPFYTMKVDPKTGTRGVLVHKEKW